MAQVSDLGVLKRSASLLTKSSLLVIWLPLRPAIIIVCSIKFNLLHHYVMIIMGGREGRKTRGENWNSSCKILTRSVEFVRQYSYSRIKWEIPVPSYFKTMR